MFSLVKFERGDYWVTPSHSVIKGNGNQFLVKFRGGRYGAKLIRRSDDKQVLLDFKQKKEETFLSSSNNIYGNFKSAKSYDNADLWPTSSIRSSKFIKKHSIEKIEHERLNRPRELKSGDDPKQPQNNLSDYKITVMGHIDNMPKEISPTKKSLIEIDLKSSTISPNSKYDYINLQLNRPITSLKPIAVVSSPFTSYETKQNQHTTPTFGLNPDKMQQNSLSNSFLSPLSNSENFSFHSNYHTTLAQSEELNVIQSKDGLENSSSRIARKCSKISSSSSTTTFTTSEPKLAVNQIGCIENIINTVSPCEPSNIICNSTEVSTLSERSEFISNGSLSEYLPDSTYNQTINSESSINTCLQKEEKSINEISSPLKIGNVNIPYSGKSKKHFCIFCKTMQTKFARHLLLRHKTESAVQEISKLPKRSKERNNIINQLRKDGDFMHNTKSSLNTGILIVSRQQQKNFKNEVIDYACCKNCKGFFSKKTLRVHLRKCGNFKQNDRTNFISSRRMTQYLHEEANEVLKTKIFPVLRDDKITNNIRYDDLIIKFGNKMTEKYSLSHQHDMIRSHLRLLGRFKIAMKELCPEIELLKEIFKPQLFDACTKALRKVANWDNSLMWFKTPAVAQHLTSLIKKCGNKQRSEYIKVQSDVLKKNLEDFLSLWEEEIPTLINKKACEDQQNQKRIKKVILPSKEDINKLFVYLKSKMVKLIQVLEVDYCYDSWVELIKATLICIQIFNRRRAGEIERLTLSNYQNKESITDSVEKKILNDISEESREFAKQFVRLTIRGKLGRTVSVLLSPLCVSSIDTIIKYRERAGISKSNEYIFCKRSASKLSKEYFRACPLLKQFSMECGAMLPESLRGTTLRKHIATYTSLLNVEEAAVDKLANFMGHHKDIHKNIYRMSIPVTEITCVSKMLMSAITDDNDVEEDEFCNTITDKDIGTSSKINAGFCSDGSDESILEEIPKKKKKRSTSPFGKTKRSRWTEEERDAIFSNFGNLKDLENLPSLQECIRVINKMPVLRSRTPQQVKTWIDNQRRYN